MRLLLLLTAFFAALTGVATGASACPQAVQASATAEQARISPVASIAPLLLQVARGTPPSSLGPMARTLLPVAYGDTYGERRRE